VAEVLSVASLLIGLLAALLLYKPAGGLLVSWGLVPKPGAMIEILGFLAVFLVVFLAVRLIERLICEGIEAAELGGIDRALGLILGLAEGLLVVSVVLVAMSLLEPAFKPIPGYARLLKGSAFARILLPIVGPELAKATQGIKLDLPGLKTPAVNKP
jgi:membrane protein required for colicin V production